MVCREDFNMKVPRKLYCPNGLHDIRKFSHGLPPSKNSFMAGFNIFSPVMKGLVHVAIWNSISFWLVLVVVINTLVYNGFLSKNITNDSIVRLILVSVYAVMNIGHQVYITTLLYHSFTFALFQACWTYISKNFLFLDLKDYQKMVMRHIGGQWIYKDKRIFNTLEVWISLDLELFGTTERSDTYRLPIRLDDVIEYYPKIHDFEELPDGDPRRRYDGLVELSREDLIRKYTVEKLPDGDPRREFNLITRDKTESKFEKLVKPLREAEIKAYEKSIDSTLEKTLANVAVLFSICVATALAPYTSVQTFNATNAQLGSYALLLSISTGFLALISSMTQLNNATESAKLLLLLQEKTIEATEFMHEHAGEASRNFSIRSKPSFGFSHGINTKSPLTWFSLWKSTRKSTSLLRQLPFLLFGLALKLIPGDRPEPGDRPDNPKMHFAAKDVKLISTISPEECGEIMLIPSEQRNETRAENLQAADGEEAEKDAEVDKEAGVDDRGSSG